MITCVYMSLICDEPITTKDFWIFDMLLDTLKNIGIEKRGVIITFLSWVDIFDREMMFLIVGLLC